MKIEKKLINKNKIKILYLSMTLFVFLMTLFGFFSTKPVKASKINDYVVLGGDSIGLNLNTNVYVTGKYAIKTENGLCKPWEDSNIEVGDIIYMINNVKINSLDDIKKNINDEGRHVLSLYRDKELVETVISARKNLKGECSLGLYVKDNILGVGTMTYYDLKTKKFASLGHGAIDGSVRNGILTKSYVSGITKGIRGVPGEKKAYLDNKELGVITDNNDFGVFGNLTNSKITGKVENELIKVASRSEVHTGKAIITTVLTGDKKENFEVNIIEVKNQNYPDIKGIKFEVTDQNLLERTGGIIQGMSGSPIVQDGVLVGAVSHVLVEDSKTGYGVFAEFMLNYT
ncbi:MAG: SpoIVB peptidase [Coprobacillus sp.]|nr:SpoIVB peptidase [Coprobacillus sp.]